MSDGIDQGDRTVSKKKKGRGPTVARWQLAEQSCERLEGATASIGLRVLEPKYTSPEAALKAVQTKQLLLARYIVREIRIDAMLTARMI